MPYPLTHSELGWPKTKDHKELEEEAKLKTQREDEAGSDKPGVSLTETSADDEDFWSGDSL